MTRLRFDRFELDPADRRLSRDGAPVELNARYLDALALLAGEAGRLVTKDRFMAEVWRGVPVTDEALTQCIRSLRRALGDDAARPRFIETVPKHGYRFVAALTGAAAPVAAAPPARWREVTALGVAGIAGGGAAGVAVGLGYGLTVASAAGGAAASALVVLLCLGVAAGVIAGAGVGTAIALTTILPVGRGWHPLVGGAVGGLVMGTVAKLIGLDAFALLLGRSPGDITGALEGSLSGAAVGLALWLGRGGLRRSVAWAAAVGGAAGALVPLLGGRLMGGSLDLMTHRFAGAPLRLDRIGALFGERGFGPVSQIVTGAIESGAFAIGVTGALVLARGYLDAQAAALRPR